MAEQSERLTRNQVVKAGRALAADTPWSEERHADYVRVFRLAYDWRNSHEQPMRKVRFEMGGRIRRLGLHALTAARLKRMSSIRKKLRETTNTLWQVQDLGGCRAILGTTEEVEALAAFYRGGGSAHAVCFDRSYIEEPKPGGYRSHHLVLAYRGTGADAVLDGRRIEVQLRTRLQHAWATTVEAVGLVRGEDLKGGAGDPDWLRLFALMSSEFVATEGCAPVPGLGDPAVRKEEVRAVNRKLGAVDVLRALNNAIKETERHVSKDSRFFLIEYDNERRVVRVVGYAESPIGRSFVASAEQGDRASSARVLVEVDKAANLRDAYPNYFLDVGVFTSHLERVVSAPDRGAVAPRPRDLSWLPVYTKGAAEGPR